MPSRLRFQQTFEATEVSTIVSPTYSASPRPVKKQKMSLSQTYYVASAARSKLGKEASKGDHNLRRLVGHANLLDSLMLELRDAERQQDAWFNHSVQSAKKEEDRHIQWADTIVEEEESEEAIEVDSDSDSDFDEADFEIAIPLRRIRSPPVTITSQPIEEDEDVEDEDMYEDIDDTPELALTRTHSHPPELVHDSDSEDDSPPTSPPQPLLEFNEKTVLDLSIVSKKSSQQLGGYIIQPEHAPTLIEAY
jgi:hypothetical protein